MLKEISDESKKNILARIPAHPEDHAKKYQGMLKNESFNVFYNGPCLVMILGLSSLKNLYADCALAAGYFMMAEASRGLGTCWVNLGEEIHDPLMMSELGIPDEHTIGRHDKPDEAAEGAFLEAVNQHLQRPVTANGPVLCK